MGLRRKVNDLYKVTIDDGVRVYNDIALLQKRNDKLRFEVDILMKKVNNLAGKVGNLHDKNDNLQKQLQCAAKGHKFLYSTAIWHWSSTIFFKREVSEIVFRCQNCGLEITKTKDKLTPKERKALIDLGVLEKPEPKSKKKKETK